MATKTPNLDLNKIQLGQDGDTWAESIELRNDNEDKTDLHDHTTGKGIPIPTAGLNINENLSLHSKNLTNIRALEFQDVSHSDVVDNNTFYRVGDGFFYKDVNGVSVNILNFVPGDPNVNIIPHLFNLPNNQGFK